MNVKKIKQKNQDNVDQALLNENEALAAAMVTEESAM